MPDYRERIASSLGSPILERGARRRSGQLMAEQSDRGYEVTAPDDTFLSPPALKQGPEPKPRHWLADTARGAGLHYLAGRISDPTSAAGLVTDAVGGVVNGVKSIANDWSDLVDDAGRPGFDPSSEKTVERAFNVGGAAMTGGALRYRPSNSLGTFGGVNAKTADQDAWSRAMAMELRGTPREEIWKETGWFKAPDGRWRFEIDDSKAKWKAPGMDEIEPGMALKAKLPKFVDHPELFKAYPKLKQTETIYGRPESYDGVPNGAYFEPSNQMRVTARDESVRGPVLGTALHEAQHGIQGIEDFGRGSGFGLEVAMVPGPSPRVQKMWDEHEARKARDRKYARSEQASEDYKRILEEERADTLAQAQRGYENNAGEVEARTVQRRQHLTAEERRARPPWLDYAVPEADQVVRRWRPEQLTRGSGEFEARPKRQWTPEEDEKLKSLIASGKSVRSVSEELGVSPDITASRMRDIGIKSSASAGRKSILSEAELKDVQRMRAEGYSRREIAERLGVSEQRISGAAWYNVMGRVNEKWTPERIARLNDLRSQGLRRKEIADALGISETQVQGALKMHGAPSSGSKSDRRWLWSDDMVTRAREMRKAGKKRREIAFELGVSDDALNHVMRGSSRWDGEP